PMLARSTCSTESTGSSGRQLLDVPRPKGSTVAWLCDEQAQQREGGMPANGPLPGIGRLAQPSMGSRVLGRTFGVYPEPQPDVAPGGPLGPRGALPRGEGRFGMSAERPLARASERKPTDPSGGVAVWVGPARPHR